MRPYGSTMLRSVLHCAPGCVDPVGAQQPQGQYFGMTFWLLRPTHVVAAAGIDNDCDPIHRHCIQRLCYNLGRPITRVYTRQVKLDSMSYDQQRGAWVFA